MKDNQKIIDSTVWVKLKFICNPKIKYLWCFHLSFVGLQNDQNIPRLNKVMFCLFCFSCHTERYETFTSPRSNGSSGSVKLNTNSLIQCS